MPLKTRSLGALLGVSVLLSYLLGFRLEIDDKEFDGDVLAKRTLVSLASGFAYPLLSLGLLGFLHVIYQALSH